MAFYNNGTNANPMGNSSGFGGHNAGFLQVSTPNGRQPNGTGQNFSGPNRNGHSHQGNRRRGRRNGGPRPNQQPRQSPNPNGVNKNGFTPRNQHGNGKLQPNMAPRQPGQSNGQRGQRGQRRQRAHKGPAVFTDPRDGDVVMRDAYAPIVAQPDEDVAMPDAPPLMETRVEYLTRGAMAMDYLATTMLNLALNGEALGSINVQMGGAPFYF